MLEKYFPELDLNISDDSIICKSCYKDLQQCFWFIKNCLNVEETIKEYCKSEGTNSKDQLQLQNLSYLSPKSLLRYQTEYSGLTAVKNKKEHYKAGVKDENGKAEESNEDFVEMKAKELYIKDGDNLKGKQNECERYPDRLVFLELPKTYEELSKVVVFPCKFQINKECTKQHGDIPEATTYKANTSKFRTNNKEYLQSHSLTHKDTTEVAMYKCNWCKYQAKYRHNLQRHIMTHKDPSEVTMYTCNMCEYSSKHKDGLRLHMSTHKDISEVRMYNCNICSFQTRHKCSLSRHGLTHKDTSEIIMHNCDKCNFQTKTKRTLLEHGLTHKSASEVTLYKCNMCGRATKRKRSLQKHMLTHKDPSEVTMYKCSMCKYQAKHKQNLKRHMFTHKDASEVEVYK